MFTVIPHPTEALILSRTQKAFLSRLNADAGKPRWIPVFPLWVFFNNFDRRAAENDTAKENQRRHASHADGAQSAQYDTAQQNICNANAAFDVPKLKTIRNAIASFTIGAPEISNDEFLLPAVLSFRNGEAVCGKIIAGKKTDEDADSPHVCENEKKLFTRFPHSCSVFRIADAEIVESKSANVESANHKIAVSEKSYKEISSASADCASGAELRTWRVNASLWVKVGR